MSPKEEKAFEDRLDDSDWQVPPPTSAMLAERIIELEDRLKELARMAQDHADAIKMAYAQVGSRKGLSRSEIKALLRPSASVSAGQDDGEPQACSPWPPEDQSEIVIDRTPFVPNVPLIRESLDRFYQEKSDGSEEGSDLGGSKREVRKEAGPGALPGAEVGAPRGADERARVAVASSPQGDPALGEGDHRIGPRPSDARVCGAYHGDNDGTCPQLTCIRPKGHDGLHDNTRGDDPCTDYAVPSQAVSDPVGWSAERSGLYDLGSEIVRRSRWKPSTPEEREGPANLYAVARDQMTIAFRRGWARAADHAGNAQRPETTSPPTVELVGNVVAAARELLKHGAIDRECFYAGRLETALSAYDDALLGRKPAPPTGSEEA